MLCQVSGISGPKTQGALPAGSWSLKWGAALAPSLWANFLKGRVAESCRWRGECLKTSTKPASPSRDSLKPLNEDRGTVAVPGPGAQLPGPVQVSLAGSSRFPLPSPGEATGRCSRPSVRRRKCHGKWCCASPFVTGADINRMFKSHDVIAINQGPAGPRSSAAY